MNKRLLLLGLSLAFGQMLHAQTLSTKTGFRFWEHHSPGIAGSKPVNCTQSGFDFVNHKYYNSFDTARFGHYANGEEANLDMVEDGGLYGGGPTTKFAFTSGVSVIWNGDIEGNGITLWMEAPASFNYATATLVSNITSAYNAATATKRIGDVKDNGVYLAKIRNTQMYVAMRTFNVKNRGGGNNDVYFDFEYKYGTVPATGLDNVTSGSALNIYPNPATDNIKLENTLNKSVTTKIVSINGQELQSFQMDKGVSQMVNISNLSSGMYFIICNSADGQKYVHKFVKG